MPRNIVRLSASEQGENEITIFTDTSKKCEVHTFNYREEGPKLNFLNALFDYIEKNYPNHSIIKMFNEDDEEFKSASDMKVITVYLAG